MKTHFYKMAGFITLSIFLFLFCTSINAQEQMEVDGVVHSKTGGFKFPDNTVQETAAAKLAPEEVSEKRGKMTVFYTGIPGVSVNLNFDVLEVGFSATHPNGIGAYSNLKIVHNVEADWPDFYQSFYQGIGFNAITVRYFDENDVHYMSIIYTNCLMKRFEQATIPFTSTSFGHLMIMDFEFQKIAINDVINANCKCFNIVLNDPNNCGCP